MVGVKQHHVFNKCDIANTSLAVKAYTLTVLIPRRLYPVEFSEHSFHHRGHYKNVMFMFETEAITKYLNINITIHTRIHKYI